MAFKCIWTIFVVLLWCVFALWSLTTAGTHAVSLFAREQLRHSATSFEISEQSKSCRLGIWVNDDRIVNYFFYIPKSKQGKQYGPQCSI